MGRLRLSIETHILTVTQIESCLMNVKYEPNLEGNKYSDLKLSTLILVTRIVQIISKIINYLPKIDDNTGSNSEVES